MDFTQLKQTMSSFETDLENFLVEGSINLKYLYFELAIMIEEQAEDIGLYRFYIREDGVRINNMKGRERLDIEEQDLAALCPNIKHKETIKIIKECALIYKSPFFNKIKVTHDRGIGIIIYENELRFEHIPLTAEFKLYKANKRKVEMEKELSNDNNKVERKIKI
jgi:hypothetical protein